MCEGIASGDSGFVEIANVPDGYVPFACSAEITTEINKAVVGSPELKNNVWYIRILNNSTATWNIGGTLRTLIVRV